MKKETTVRVSVSDLDLAKLTLVATTWVALRTSQPYV